jgi:chromosome segregation ATPase
MYDENKSPFPRSSEDDDLNRRESALNQRIASFENIVRKTKLSTAERLEHLVKEETELSTRWNELHEALEALGARENDLRRREALVEEEIAKLNARESALRQNTEAFQARSEQVLRQIDEQKEELRGLINVRLG